MFCPNCGMTVTEETKFCPGCGAILKESNANQWTQDVNQAFRGAESQLGNAFNDIRNSFTGGGAPRGPRLTTDRSLLMYIILTIVTCGIYGWWFIYSLAQDVNTACEGDGENTPGLVAFIVLSYITCGIYAYWWYYKLGNRLQSNAYRYGMQFSENGTTVLLWLIFGSFLCGIGPFVAIYILIKNTNAICRAYNQVNGYGA
ncbi:MAG: DUF4234 domain-containing protein [Lachnospiraceae bacterium]|nr:DUF4234 domain-containing protein [Lachnospiraceae bacterium]